MNRFSCIAILLICSYSLIGQSVPQLRELAKKSFDLERYLDAIEFYEKVVALDRNDEEARFNLAYCYFKTFKFDQAAEQYLVLVENEDKELSGEALYYFGTILKLNSKYAKADSVFTHLIENYDINEYVLQQARKQKEGCVLAQNIEIQNRGYSIDKMDMNSQFHDFGAAVNFRDQSLSYATTRNVSSSQIASTQFAGLLPDIVRLKRKNNRWQNATSKEDFNVVNSKWAEGSGSYTADGKYYYFTSCRTNEGAECDIMVSKFENEKWSEPVALNKYINADSVENKHPFISHTGDTLFFVSNREGGYGGSDIWMSIKGIEEGSWTPAINMGDVINTQFNEITPFYSSAFRALIFASDGHVGYGGYDLFLSKGESFFEPEIYNLGFPFNSPLDDTYFIIQDSIGYVSTNREDRIHLNLYSFDVNDEALYLSLLISGESLIDTRIISRFKQVRSLDLTTFRIEDYQGFELFEPVKRTKSKPKILEESESSLLAFEEIPEDDDSQSSLLSASDFGSSANPSISDTYHEHSAERPITAGPIEGGKIELQHIPYEKIHFGFGSVRLTKAAIVSLDNLIDQLKDMEGEYENIDVLVYSDPVGSAEYNLELSKERGYTIVRYLTEHGIEKKKISLFAKGETELISDGHEWYDDLFNRRAEFFINSPLPLPIHSSHKLAIRHDMSIDEAATRLGFTPTELGSWNNFVEDMLHKGQFIRIDAPLRIIPDIHYFLDEKDLKYHFFPYIVRRGDTLESIARKFHTPEELLFEINQVKGGITPGDELFIYRINF